MRALVLEVPETLLVERRKKGLDRWDEVWGGFLHMVPPPSGWHQELGTDLVVAFTPIAKKLGLRISYETGVFRPNSPVLDYRQPDIVISRPEYRTARGVEGPCELAVEILSPDDETYEKLPFYGEVGVRELLVVHPETRTHQLFALSGKVLAQVPPDASGRVRSTVLDVTLSVAPGPKLRLIWEGGETLI